MRVLINGKEHNVTDPKEFAILMLQMVGGRGASWEYSTLEVLKDNINTALDLIVVFCRLRWEKEKGSGKAKLTRLRKRAEDRRAWEGVRSKVIFVRRYYELILSLEGKGSLSGFGFTNKYGDQIAGNAERLRITRIGI